MPHHPRQGGGAEAVGWLVVLASANQIHGQAHFFTVPWAEDGVEQELTVEAPKHLAPKLAKTRETVTGTKWMDLEQRCNGVRAR